MNDLRIRWASDWAWIGAISGLAIVFFPHPIAIFFSVLSGAVSGMLVGVALRALWVALPSAARLPAALLFTPIPLGSWGSFIATTGVTAHLLSRGLLWDPLLTPAAAISGYVAGVCQMAICVPSYALLAHLGYARWPAIVLGLLFLPVSAWLGAMVGIFFAIR